MTLSTKDRVVSPIRGRQFFDNVRHDDKVKLEFEVGHEVLANPDLKDDLIEAQLNWLEDKL